MSLQGKLRKKGVEIESPNDASVYKGHIQIGGRLVTVDTTEVRVLIYDNNKDVFLCSGETVPTDAEDGFAKGCIFIHTSAAAGVKSLYENVETANSCKFNAIGAITEDEIVIPEGELLIGNADDEAESHSISGDVSISSAGVAQIALGVIVNSDINAAAAIDTTKLANGTISNTEFQYLNGVTGGIQGQLDAITALADANIYIGDASGQFAERAVGGDAQMTREGVVTINSHAADVLVATDKKMQFRDTGLFIQSTADGKLLISSDGADPDAIGLTGDVTITGDLTVTGGVVLSGGVVVVPDDTTYSALVTNSGKVHILPDFTADCTVSLPTPTNGLDFEFIYEGNSVDVQNVLFDTGSDTNFFLGGLLHIDTDAGPAGSEVARAAGDGDSNSILTVVTPDVGTRVRLICDGTNWYLTGIVVSATIPSFADQA